jgi:monoamine oxidase
MVNSKEGFLWTPSSSRHGLETDAVAVSSSNVRDKYDAVVIGAGFSGLVAARDLSKVNGLSVLLVEARDRIGGRTWTSSELGEDIEMGGTWIHWNQPHVYSELDRYNLHKAIKPTLASVSPERAFHNFGSTIENVEGDALIRAVESTAEQVFAIDGLNSRTLMPYPHDPFRKPSPWVRYDHLTIKDRLDQMDLHAKERELFESYISLFGLNAAADTGFTEVLRWYSLSGHSMAGVYELTSFYKLGNGGMTQFARAILNDAKCDRLLDTQVSKIDQSGTNVVVTSKNGRIISAQVVISTIPLNVLSDVQFLPPLDPLRNEAVGRGQPNMGAKLHFKLKDPEPVWFGTASVTLRVIHIIL